VCRSRPRHLFFSFLFCPFTRRFLLEIWMDGWIDGWMGRRISLLRTRTREGRSIEGERETE
jgi:hypothetical protein